MNELNETSTSDRARSTSRRRWFGVAGVIAVALTVVACDISTLGRHDEPVVLTGGDLGALVGVAPNRIVAECLDGPDGVTLRMIVDGVSVNTVVDTDDPIASGATGFRVDSGAADAEAAFDDYVVSAPAAP